ncbi:MAG: protein-L-isoaspartate(D-aspartate) O-methyltransferase [Sedimentisphaerales bacterium]|nr:protein-L-isoaspartate(D-aspartate) O-methyltransferase [Sedimentisphaerales bacterium]
MTEEQEKNIFDAMRERMLKYDLKGRGITDPRVLKVMEEVPREDFVPNSHRSQSYKDGPLPIGLEQTISQPYIVALMTQELHISKDCIVLEIGTGSGYQTAILSRHAKKVYTIERFDELSQKAQAVLAKLGYDNVEFYVGDGSEGWPVSKLPHNGCFDRIIVTAAVPAIPMPLINQLTDGGLMVIPVGYSGVQELILCEKRVEKIIERKICSVRFVKLFGKYGFQT